MNISLKIKTYSMWGNSIYTPDYQFILGNKIVYRFQPWRKLVWSCEFNGKGCGLQVDSHSIRYVLKTIRKVYEN